METYPQTNGEPRKPSGGKRRPNVQEMMQIALDDNGGDEAAATKDCVDRALEDVEYVREIFALAIHWTNKRGAHSRRTASRRSATMVDREAIRTLGTALARPMLEFPLQDGTMLKDATAGQVDQAARQFGLQGQTMLHLSRWMMAIRAKITDDKPVGEVIDELTVRQLFDETRHDTIR